MADVNFIEFYTTLDEALNEKTSPQINLYEVRGVHLLPNQVNPYIQVTNKSGGIELEDWTAYIVNTWDGTETDVTAQFLVEDIFTDINSDNQFVWSLTNVPHDFGQKMLYLKVVQLAAETFYSNMFQLTDENSDRVVRLDYKSYDSDYMQGIGLRMFYWQELKNLEIDTYYETSTKNTVINVVKSQKYQKWLTDRVISNSLFMKITDAFECKYTYLDLIRCNLFEAPEIKEHSGTQNYGQNVLKIAFNSNDIYDPLTPVVPVPVIPSITLTSVIPNGSTAIYTFSYSSIIPSYFVFEYSSDQVAWTSTTKGITSPQEIAFTETTGVWYFRIKHPLAISNVISFDLASRVIAVSDTYYCRLGQTLDLPVMTNDTTYGVTTITGVTTPTNGTASIIESGTKIRYVDPQNTLASSTFDYTISDGVTSSTNTVFVTKGVGGLELLMGNSRSNPLGACSINPYRTKYSNTFTGIIEIGDFIYNDAELTDLFTTDDKYFSIGFGKWIQIGGNGEVINKGNC